MFKYIKGLVLGVILTVGLGDCVVPARVAVSGQPNDSTAVYYVDPGIYPYYYDYWQYPYGYAYDYPFYYPYRYYRYRVPYGYHSHYHYVPHTGGHAPHHR